MLGPILRGAAVSLEPAQLEDAAVRCRWFADLELSRWWTGPDVPSLKQEEESFDRAARDPALVLWRIALEGRTIGSAWLTAIDWRNRQAWQGMVIGERAEWGKGYGSEVVALRTAFAFEDLGLERLETSCLERNVGMQRALARSGFRRIGIRQHRFFLQGGWHHELLFELLCSEWRERQRSHASRAPHADGSASP
jgi:RimJ/RimL family protein N-acetyltransferase